VILLAGFIVDSKEQTVNEFSHVKRSWIGFLSARFAESHEDLTNHVILPALGMIFHILSTMAKVWLYGRCSEQETTDS
jgi:hypothetical protein